MNKEPHLYKIDGFTFETYEEYRKYLASSEEFSSAYTPWTLDLDDELRELAKSKGINELAHYFKRRTGAIRSRLKKLNLVKKLEKKKIASKIVEAIRSELIIDDNRLYLGYYNDGEIKQEVLNFKNGRLDAVFRWTGKATELAESFPEINIVVRALGHAELVVEGTEKPLDELATALAITLGAEYHPAALHKSKVLQKSFALSRSVRAAQVEGVYTFNVPESVLVIDRPRFLIVDDVYTSGATTGEIQRAIVEACPAAQVFVFTLAKALYRSEANKASVEMQHNNQLFSDLYNKLSSETEFLDGIF